MKKALALGKAPIKAGIAKIVKPRTIEDRLVSLENMVASIIEITSKNSQITDKPDSSLNAYNEMPRNKDGIPLYISLIGSTKFGPRILYVADDGYYIGNIPYGSLSSAAEAASGILRKSGWVFWKLPDGTSLKKAFKKAK